MIFAIQPCAKKFIYGKNVSIPFAGPKLLLELYNSFSYILYHLNQPLDILDLKSLYHF